MTSPGWLDRYQSGYRSDVWHELRQLGAAIHDSDDHLAEAQEVCDEMARRARRNVEVIVQRLTEQGFRFHTNDDDQTPCVPYVPPGDNAVGVIDWLEAQFSSVPLTLLSWIRIVGDVWLVGSHPEWPESTAADPLVIEAEGARYPTDLIQGYFDGELNAHEEWSSEAEDAGVFVLPLAPDRLHKDNVSGGPPYGMMLPDGCADGLFVAETPMPFVSYLNSVFRSGGFPAPSSGGWRVKQALAADLLPV